MFVNVFCAPIRMRQRGYTVPIKIILTCLLVQDLIAKVLHTISSLWAMAAHHTAAAAELSNPR